MFISPTPNPDTTWTWDCQSGLPQNGRPGWCQGGRPLGRQSYGSPMECLGNCSNYAEKRTTSDLAAPAALTDSTVTVVCNVHVGASEESTLLPVWEGWGKQVKAGKQRKKGRKASCQEPPIGRDILDHPDLSSFRTTAKQSEWKRKHVWQAS